MDPCSRKGGNRTQKERVLGGVLRKPLPRGRSPESVVDLAKALAPQPWPSLTYAGCVPETQHSDPVKRNQEFQVIPCYIVNWKLACATRDGLQKKKKKII